jgi:hypothetical protein
MKAYLQGVRDYNDALKDGRIAGPDAEEVIDAIAPLLRDQGSRHVAAKAAASEHGPYKGVPGERRPPSRWL